ncbi:hypothetical protein N136_00108 [Leifsonia aquatica ATCC 14665]|uniref:Uncharacterized protein n=1 Tax=Leifsonia aquatica ATCC 14665 TaxID=1358026 RepID=U2RE73_LEIAQ|nr:hypothetical protein N136_00108 [Leifsonia aquatica ATCC 14665]
MLLLRAGADRSIRHRQVLRLPCPARLAPREPFAGAGVHPRRLRGRTRLDRSGALGSYRHGGVHHP